MSDELLEETLITSHVQHWWTNGKACSAADQGSSPAFPIGLFADRSITMSKQLVLQCGKQPNNNPCLAYHTTVLGPGSRPLVKCVLSPMSKGMSKLVSKHLLTHLRVEEAGGKLLAH